MAPKTPSTTTQISKVELPEWVDKAAQDNYKLATELGTDKFQQYQGDRVAGLNDNIMAAIKAAQTGAGSEAGNFNSADNIFKTINKLSMGYNPQSITSGNVKAGQTGYHNTVADLVGSSNVGTKQGKFYDTTAGSTAADAVKAGMLKDTDLSAYLNPYTAEVEKNAMASLDRSRLASLNDNASAAAAASAFGGSRHGIVDAVTNAESALNAGTLSGQLRQAGYDRATSLAMSDIDRNLMADVGNADRRLTSDMANMDRRLTSDTNNANRRTGVEESYLSRLLNADTSNADRRLSADVSNADRRLNSATNNANRQTQIDQANVDRRLTADTGNVTRKLQADQFNAQNILDSFLAKTGAMSDSAKGLMSSATGQQDARLKDLQSLLTTGGIQQNYDQSVIDADRAKFDEKRNYDLENLNLRLSALGMSPYGKSESTTKTQTGGSSGTDFGQLGMGIFSLLLGLSDDDSKTDKEKIGKVPGTDLDMYAWRYKNDPKTYPKVVGVMASDLEKKLPEAVHKLDGGKRIVDYGQVMRKIVNG